MHPSSAPLRAAELAGPLASVVQLSVPSPVPPGQGPSRAEAAQAGHAAPYCSDAKAPHAGRRRWGRLTALVQFFWEMGGKCPPSWHCCSDTRRGVSSAPHHSFPVPGQEAEPSASAAHAPLPVAMLPASSSPAALALPTSELLRATWPPVWPVPPVAGAGYTRGDAVLSSSTSLALGVPGTSGRAMSNMGRVC